MSDLNIFYPEGKKITIQGEEFSIKPFVLKNRTQVLRILSEMILLVAKVMPNIKPEELKNADIIPALLNVAGDKLIDIYKIVLNKDIDWLNDITLAEEIQLIQTILEVNNIPFLMLQVKSMIKTIKAQTA